ncbi:hypothetical protein F7725_025746 [Dissostichus mawsoni]|uniref:Katanin p80 WD40 repeat-containing subunit B1 n=1 Tax=Dissostichus mawsoni TaxID=36200 RepID=A0A7J5X544_DISMA|nr:hypothetical protein F7725_025746 [Dissostichus mawsoni]
MAASNSTKISWRLQEFEAHSSSVSCLSLGKSSGRLLATGGEDCRVNIWAVSKANCIMVVAGSQSGSIRVWDLEAAKILRTLMGHKSNITSLGFHPFGDFLASSSTDTNIKLWDVRRKGYVFRYKGHTQAVRSLAFSPDGKWLASASDDCTIKLWDLTQGKTITEFKSHTAAVNIVQFHPNEYLLASGSSDRCVFFSADGSCLYSGATDTLRVFGWEPDRCFDVVPVGWGRVSDLAVCNQQLIGVSHHLSSVSSFVVDLKRVKKSGGAALQGVIQDNQPIPEHKDPKAAALRRNYERPSTACSASQRVKQRSEAERQSPEGERRNTVLAVGRQLKDLVSPFPEKMQVSERSSSLFSAWLLLWPPPPGAEGGAYSGFLCEAFSSSLLFLSSSSSVPPPPSQLPLNTGKSKPPLKSSEQQERANRTQRGRLPTREGGALSDDEALSQLKKGHDTMCVMLRSRHRNLETVRGVWARQDIKSALDAAVSMNDLSIVVDILNIINCSSGSLHDGLPQIEQLLQSKYESYIQTGCSSLKMIMKHFWKLISETLRATPSVGVDITREERRQKCRLCCRQLQNLSNMVKTRRGGGGNHGEPSVKKARRRVPHAVIFSRPAEETRPSDSSLTHIVF